MSHNKLPQHITIIMDGNGRWAKKRLLPRTAGHKAGAKAVRKTIEECVKREIPYLSLFAFSSENWQRPQDEVNTLMELFFTHLEKEMPLFEKHNIRLKVIGNLSQFSDKLQQRIQESQNLTAKNTGLTVIIAASYGGQWDIVQATQKLATAVKEGKISAADITSDTFAQHLCTKDIPNPDLFIRTSGEQRISNYMLWQLAYTEFYFTDTLWPDFDTKQFELALDYFHKRQRRFGKTAEQIA